MSTARTNNLDLMPPPLARAIQRGEVADAEEVVIEWPDGQRRWLSLRCLLRR